MLHVRECQAHIRCAHNQSSKVESWERGRTTQGDFD